MSHACSDEQLVSAPIVSRHSVPQPSPQEWGCGCVTAVYITDADALNGGEPFEMRLAERCGKRSCQLHWSVAPQEGSIWRSARNTTGREWRAAVDRPGVMKMIPLGGDYGLGGGVKVIRVPWDRLCNPRFWERVR
jgi:hypothetical protein